MIKQPDRITRLQRHVRYTHETRIGVAREGRDLDQSEGVLLLLRSAWKLREERGARLRPGTGCRQSSPVARSRQSSVRPCLSWQADPCVCGDILVRRRRPVRRSEAFVRAHLHRRFVRPAGKCRSQVSANRKRGWLRSCEPKFRESARKTHTACPPAIRATGQAAG